MLQGKNRLSRKKGSRKPFKRNKKPSTETKAKIKTDQVLIENLMNKHIPMACSLCVFMGQKFSDIVQHFRSIHPKQKPFVMCCERKLSKRYYLSQHALKHENPEHSNFASEYLLAIHNSMRHSRETNVCHVCAKAIRDKRSFEKHVCLHFEDSGPRVKCPYPDCESWLKDEENLKLHLKHHNPPEGIICKCTECGNHEHMAQHMGETLHKCPICARTLNSNANMHARKKKMHPKEWDEWRKSKRGSSQLLISHSSSIF
uniref:C2H2-type domain-containing protein n=1 Tax=Glossina morsitans morsitans TaxID=37546 RepID=A0A1B0FFK8_GLOMM